MDLLTTNDLSPSLPLKAVIHKLGFADQEGFLHIPPGGKPLPCMDSSRRGEWTNNDGLNSLDT